MSKVMVGSFESCQRAEHAYTKDKLRSGVVRHVIKFAEIALHLECCLVLCVAFLAFVKRAVNKSSKSLDGVLRCLRRNVNRSQHIIFMRWQLLR